jgi:hypothetical protein
MNVAEIAAELTQLLAPLLPFLTSAGKAYSDGILKKAGGDTFDVVKSKVWDRLKPKMDESPEAKFALEQLAKRPQSADYRESFVTQLAHILQSDQDLAAELETFLQSGITQTILAEKDSDIADATQEATGDGLVQQKIMATQDSTIRGVRQTKR